MGMWILKVLILTIVIYALYILMVITGYVIFKQMGEKNDRK